MECDNSIVKNVKHEEPTSEVGTSGSLNSDMLYHDDDDDDDDDDDEMMDNWDDVDDDFDLDYEGDYMFEILESDDESHYLSIQSRFDNINLPPGVEASFFWLNNLPTSNQLLKFLFYP
ncbi:unnamed protein product [Lactuca saligna]|uniref:Uncharacterized protein n=1 Tax=Lactuca saligna TaxID=75948 RepID=A0AA35ZVD5_LACSI|nr:unnamed protein product [Lactuca saligna]